MGPCLATCYIHIMHYVLGYMLHITCILRVLHIMHYIFYTYYICLYVVYVSLHM